MTVALEVKFSLEETRQIQKIVQFKTVMYALKTIHAPSANQDSTWLSKTVLINVLSAITRIVLNAKTMSDTAKHVFLGSLFISPSKLAKDQSFLTANIL